MRNSHPIMLIENNPLEAMRVRRALEALSARCLIAHSTDGEEALIYLRNSNNKKPCLILLNLDMPKMSGVDFLQTLKEDKALRSIPVVVLSTSGSSENVSKTYQLGVAGFIVKPHDDEGFEKTIDSINHYWKLSEVPCDN